MKNFNRLLKESMTLTVFEMLKKLEGFLQETYGITAFGTKEDNGFVMYMSKYLDEEQKEQDISEKIKNFVNKECNFENVEVHKDNYGYHITFGHNAEAAKLIEVTQADGSGISGAKTTYVGQEEKKPYKCSICGEEHEGMGNDPWPVDMNPIHRVCDKCDDEVVIPARLKFLSKKESKINEALDHKAVEHAAANTILDPRFTWYFNILDESSRDIAEGIDNIRDAMEVFIKNEAAFFVAFPFIDPKPDDANVEMVFADNPGPIVVYDNEEVTIPKKTSKPTKPSVMTKPKRPKLKEKEEVVKESSIKDYAYDTYFDTVYTEWVRLYDRLNLDKEDLAISGPQNLPPLWWENEFEDILIGDITVEDTVESVIGIDRPGRLNFEVKKFIRNHLDAYKELNYQEAVIEESRRDIDNYRVVIDFSSAWYDLLGEDTETTPYEAMEGQMAIIEDVLYDNGIFLSFDYVGQQSYDIASNFATLEECEEAEELLVDFFGEQAYVFILEKEF